MPGTPVAYSDVPGFAFGSAQATVARGMSSGVSEAQLMQSAMPGFAFECIFVEHAAVQSIDD